MGDSLFDTLKKQQEAKDKTAPKQEPDNELTKKLQEVGDACQVNPPEPSSKPPAPVVTEEKEKTPPVKQSAAEGVCPFCGKKFKHLSRHKCKEREAAKVPDSELTEEELAVRKILDEEKAKLDMKLEAPEETEASEIAKTVKKAVKAQSTPVGEHFAFYDLALDAVVEKSSKSLKLVHFSDIILPLCKLVAKENQCENWNTVEYARGPGLLCAKLERYFEKNMPEGILLADTSTQECRACLEVLKEYARNVLKGVR